MAISRSEDQFGWMRVNDSYSQLRIWELMDTDEEAGS